MLSIEPAVMVRASQALFSILLDELILVSNSQCTRSDGSEG